MIGRLDPEENVMDDSLIAKRKATAICNQGVREKLLEAISKLGWDLWQQLFLMQLLVVFSSLEHLVSDGKLSS